MRRSLSSLRRKLQVDGGLRPTKAKWGSAYDLEMDTNGLPATKAVQDGLRIRRYRPDDLAAVYRICLLTGDSGGDASHLYDDPAALGHMYVGPYVTLEPELAFVIEDSSGESGDRAFADRTFGDRVAGDTVSGDTVSGNTVSGYVVGAFDTKVFHQAMLDSWLPPLQAALPDPGGDPTGWTASEKLYHRLHHPGFELDESLEPYPSHLHIDLLPRAQGRGFGRRLIERLLMELQGRGSPGVHLGVDAVNERALGFYRRLRFHELYRSGSSSHRSVLMVRSLSEG